MQTVATVLVAVLAGGGLSWGPYWQQRPPEEAPCLGPEESWARDEAEGPECLCRPRPSPPMVAGCEPTGNLSGLCGAARGIVPLARPDMSVCTGAEDTTDPEATDAATSTCCLAQRS